MTVLMLNNNYLGGEVFSLATGREKNYYYW